MSFDAVPFPPKHIAVIGAGISGMGAAYYLGQRHRVTLIEAEPRLGGHARTVLAGRNGDVPVDTGFIVFNYENYPHLTKLFDDLNVPVAKSDMSFGTTIDHGRIEYGLGTYAAVLGQRRNILRPDFHRMVRDILKFNARAEAAAEDPNLTVHDLMAKLELGPWFREYYLLPLCGAIWSTPPEEIGRFPAKALIQFFRNHALLHHSGQHQWWTVDGGSIEYVNRLEAHLRGLGVDIQLGSPVRGVTRTESGVTIHRPGLPPIEADEVIFACHSDQALAMLDQPTATETKALGDISYQPNEVILHRDPAQMPKRKRCWSSWVYKADFQRPNPQMGVTYWMNKLQNIPEDDPLFVSLNPIDAIPDEMIYDQITFMHPVFDHAALAAQDTLWGMQGQNNTWFAGAYTRHGFHEDGLASAYRISDMMRMRETGAIAA